MDRHYSYEEVKGLKRLYEDDIEAGEKYCIPLPRWYGGDWNEQQFDILVADKPIKKRNAVHLMTKAGHMTRYVTTILSI